MLGTNQPFSGQTQEANVSQFQTDVPVQQTYQAISNVAVAVAGSEAEAKKSAEIATQAATSIGSSVTDATDAAHEAIAAKDAVAADKVAIAAEVDSVKDIEQTFSNGTFNVAVTQVAAGAPATGTASFDANSHAINFTFDIPAGADGGTGQRGPAGSVPTFRIQSGHLWTSDGHDLGPVVGSQGAAGSLDFDSLPTIQGVNLGNAFAAVESGSSTYKISVTDLAAALPSSGARVTGTLDP